MNLLKIMSCCLHTQYLKTSSENIYIIDNILYNKYNSPVNNYVNKYITNVIKKQQ